MSTSHSILLCTCPDHDTAMRLAETLVNESLAACVNLIPNLTAIYRWEGQIQRDTEVLLLIKTVAAAVAPLTARLQQLHPYQVPEIIALPIVAGSDQYLQWLSQCVNVQQ